ncbi:MAG: TonB-dependent receptor [Prevotellaceae bacterium]|nr:TonB-dependent receptor [Candidatus Faecinaster equi]
MYYFNKTRSLLLVTILLLAFSINGIASTCHIIHSDSLIEFRTDSNISKQNEKNNVNLSTAIIKVTKIDKDISSTSSRQSISRFQFNQQGVVDISDAINRLPGLTLRDYGGEGGIKTISVRGMGAAHTAVSYDGVSLTDTQTGQIDISRFTLNNIANLSLVIGDDFSTMLPAKDATHSATLQITSIGVLNNLNNLKPHYGIHLENGSYNHWSGLFNYSQKLSETFSITANVDYRFNLGNYHYTLTNGYTKTREKRNNSRLNAYHGEINTTWKTGRRGTFDSKIYYYKNHHHLPGIVKLYNPINNERQDEQNAFIHLRREYLVNDKMRTQFMLKYNWEVSDYKDFKGSYPNGIKHEKYTQQEYYGSALFVYDINKSLCTSYAIDLVNNKLKSNQVINNDVSRFGILQSLTTRYKYGNFQIAGRILYSIYDNKNKELASAKDAKRLTPSISANYKLLNGLYVRAFYKNIFRMPTFTESYYVHLGNTDILPEKTTQTGVGFTWQTIPSKENWKNLRITVDGYHNMITDKIMSVPISLYLWRITNLGKCEGNGIDITLQSEYEFNKYHNVLLYANYSYQTIVDKSFKGSATYNNQLPYTPKHIGSISVAYENPFLNISTTICGNSERYSIIEHSDGTRMSGHAEWNFSLWKTYKIKNNEITLKGDLKNVLNRQYEVIAGYPMPGRVYLLSTNIKF